jgi:hypothetical protein
LLIVAPPAITDFLKSVKFLSILEVSYLKPVLKNLHATKIPEIQFNNSDCGFVVFRDEMGVEVTLKLSARAGGKSLAKKVLQTRNLWLP